MISLIGYLVFRDKKTTTKYMLYGSSLLALTTPITLEQTNFILQSIEVPIAVIIQILSVLFISKSSTSSKVKQKLFLLLSVVCLAFSFSVYQSLVASFPILVVIVIYFELDDDIKFGDLIKKATPYILVFLLALVLYFLCNKIVYKIFDVIDVGYISYDFYFLKVPIKQYLIESLRTIKQTFFYVKTPFLFIITSFYMGALFLLIIFNKKRSIETKFCLFIALTIVSISVYFLIITLGSTGPVRTYYPTIPFALFYLYLACYNEINSLILKKIFLIITIFLTLLQGFYTYKLGETTNIIYKEDVKAAKVIKKELTRLNIKPDKKHTIAVYGGLDYTDIQYTSGEIIGRSLFSYDTLFILGNSQRVSNFLTSQGFEIRFVGQPTIYKDLSSNIINMPHYPNKGFIQIYNNYLLINLSGIS